MWHTQCVYLCVCVSRLTYPWGQRNHPQEADRFRWQTAAVSSSSHCPFPSQTVKGSFCVKSKYQIQCPKLFFMSFHKYPPARTRQSACCCGHNACRSCSSASPPNRSPASHTASPAGRQDKGLHTDLNLFNSIRSLSIKVLSFAAMLLWCIMTWLW